MVAVMKELLKWTNPFQVYPFKLWCDVCAPSSSFSSSILLFLSPLPLNLPPLPPALLFGHPSLPSAYFLIFLCFLCPLSRHIAGILDRHCFKLVSHAKQYEFSTSSSTLNSGQLSPRSTLLVPFPQGGWDQRARVPTIPPDFFLVQFPEYRSILPLPLEMDQHSQILWPWLLSFAYVILSMFCKALFIAFLMRKI